MFTHKDIECRSIFVINCLNERSLRVSNGELLLEEPIVQSDKMRTLTKLPFQKILAIFVIGHIRITTPLIEKCHKFNVALVVMKPTLRPIFFWSNSAEANYLLRLRQYNYPANDLSIARYIVENKITNQLKVLQNTRCKDPLSRSAIISLTEAIKAISTTVDYNSLMGIEGVAAKLYFEAMFQQQKWKGRHPRSKCDVLNVTLDIGYTILFNFVECFLRMFGFDLYVGVYHRLWFKRKSLVCDLMEPLRPIIDKTARTAWNRKEFIEKDFHLQKGEWRLKHENNSKYCHTFFEALMPYKSAIFKYIQGYYRCFMGKKSVTTYPKLTL